ncbi:MAG: hypothetical protein NC123_15195 [Butyrivibrio sp.]|nr:hypothetical protein [Acetatifactor muris]MCM1560866.1 hypothetical protein [Butyrivibrio sp.]
MAKKQKNRQSGKPAAENYYDLKTDAVNRLVNAENAPEVSDAEIRKYKSRGKLNIPSWLKIVFVKFWFSGAICYFFLWGLGTYISGLDLMFVLAVGLGAAMDLMVNNLLHYFEPEKGAYDRWMMVSVRKFWSLFLNVIYAGVLLYCVIWAYNVINTLLVGSVETAQTVAVPVEPILFGLLYMGFDMLFITIRNTILKVVRDANAKVSGKK